MADERGRSSLPATGHSQGSGLRLKPQPPGQQPTHSSGNIPTRNRPVSKVGRTVPVSRLCDKDKPRALFTTKKRRSTKKDLPSFPPTFVVFVCFVANNPLQSCCSGQEINSPLPEGLASAILFCHTPPALHSLADERGRSSLPATANFPRIQGRARCPHRAALLPLFVHSMIFVVDLALHLSPLSCATRPSWLRKLFFGQD